MMADKDFEITMGKTFQHVLRWEAPPYIYKPITAITNSAPCRITAAAHGVPNGWRVAVVSVKGMTQINAATSPPKLGEYHRVTVVDANTLELNEVNAADYKPYVSGGFVQYRTPVDMTGFTARMKVKDKVGGVVLMSTEVGDAPNNTLSVTLDTINNTITLLINATATAALTWKKGVYDLELVSSGGVVTELLAGKIIVNAEVTT